MKKFKDLQINIGSDSRAINELVSIENKCDGTTFIYSEDVERQYAPDDKMLHILANVPLTPQAVMLVYASNGSIKILNIVPYNHSTDRLSKEEYNTILDAFDELVIRPLFNTKYQITKTDEEIQMQSLIPVSYQSLYRFVNCPGWPSPFSHPNDRERWCEFICSLNANNEYLSTGDLEQWLREDVKAPGELIEQITYKYEDATELLEYYVRNYN